MFCATLNMPTLQGRSRLCQVPVYDAGRILAGAAVVEILASSIEVAPARQSISG